MAVADLDQDAAQQVAKGLTHEARRHLAVWLDVTDVSSVEQAFADATFGLGGIDIVVSVAGGDTDHGRFEETKDEVWVRMLELNLLGVVRCCRAAIAHLRQHQESAMVSLAASLAPDGIRVNTVAPATIRTRNWDRQEGGRIAFAISTRSDASASLRTSLPQSRSWPAMRPGSPDTLPVDGGL